MFGPSRPGTHPQRARPARACARSPQSRRGTHGPLASAASATCATRQSGTRDALGAPAGRGPDQTRVEVPAPAAKRPSPTWAPLAWACRPVSTSLPITAECRARLSQPRRSSRSARGADYAVAFRSTCSPNQADTEREVVIASDHGAYMSRRADSAMDLPHGGAVDHHQRYVWAAALTRFGRGTGGKCWRPGGDRDGGGKWPRAPVYDLAFPPPRPGWLTRCCCR